MFFGFLIGAGSGLASALLFYSAARGSPLLSTMLLLLTPLPSMLAGLGWGWLAGVAGALTGCLLMGALVGPTLAIGFLLAVGVPAVGAAYLAYLSRPDPNAPSARQWYPPGRLLALASLYGGALPVLVLPLIGGSYDILRPPLADLLGRLSTRAAPELGVKPLNPQQIESLAEVVSEAVPGAFAAYWLAIFAGNLYLAARIARASGRFARDWPDLPALSYPPGFPLLLALALLSATGSGVLGIAGISFTGALLLAYLLAGLALVHFIARRRAPWALWLLYPALLLFEPYTAIALIGVALIEPLFKLKARLGSPPPTT